MDSKPKSNAVLKTLPEERQAQIAEWCAKPNDVDQLTGRPVPKTGGLTYAREQLAADGLKVSLETLSQFFNWWQRRQRYAAALEASEHQRELMEKFRPGDKDLAREFAEFTLLQKASALEDKDLFSIATMAADSRRRLDLEERSAKTKAQIAKAKIEQKERDFALQREKFITQSCEKIMQAARDPKIREIAEDSKLTGAEKIAAIRAAYFADIDAVEVQLPA